MRQPLANWMAQLQVADLLGRPRRGPLVYGMGRIDQWGLISNRATIDALGLDRV